MSMEDAKKAYAEEKAARDLTWDEIGIEQRQERLRTVLRRVDRRLGELMDEIHRLRSLAASHSHTNNGAVVIPVDIFNRPLGYSDGVAQRSIGRHELD